MTGLIGWWPLHENSGKARDLSGNGNHGTLNGPTQGVAGPGGTKSYRFVRSNNDDVSIGDVHGLTSTDYTLSVWVKRKKDSGSRETFFGKSSGDDGWQFMVWSDDKLTMTHPGVESHYSDQKIPLDEWGHAVATYDNSTQVSTIYYNGMKVSTKSFPNPLSNSTGLELGQRGDGDSRSWGGNLADARIYDRVLSPLEVKKLYEMGAMARAPEDGVSYYKLDGNTNDSWNGNDGIANNVSWVSGKYGQAASFNGTDSSIDVSSPTGFPHGGSNEKLTVSFWYNPDDKSNQRLMGIDNEWEVEYDNTGNQKIGLYTFGGNSQSDKDPFDTGKWLHITVVWDPGNQTKYYFDGVHDSTKSTSDTSSDSGNSFHIGDYSGGTTKVPNGDFDDVRIYDRALKDWEIKALYHGYNDVANPPGASDSGAVARWKFDDKVNSGVKDSWGSNDGTIKGAPVYTNNSVRGKSMDFDGSNDYIALNDIIVGFTEMTVSSWYYVPSNESHDTYERIFTNGGGGSGRKTTLALRPGSDEYDYSVSDGSTQYGKVTGSMIYDAWVFLAMTWDGSTLRLFENSRQVSSTSASFGSIGDEGDTTITRKGAKDFSEKINGKLDDIRVYSRALSPSELFQLYQWGTRGRDMRKLTINARGDQ